MVVGILATLVILLLGIFLGSHPSSLPTVLRGTVFDPDRNLPATEQALNILTRRYFRPLDRAKLQDLGLAGMVKSLEDPYSHYIDPSSRDGSQGEGDEQSVGIGIGVEAVPQGMRILDVRDHSPAAAAGLRRDDVIIKAGPVSLAKRDEASGAELIRGRPGTTVSITFLRDGTEHTVNIERAATEVPVAAERMLHYDGVPIGYLRFTGFSEGSAEKLRTATKTALDDHARALILDLRENGGGLIREAITVASIFIAQGTIMSAVERERPRRVYQAEGNPLAPKIPMVVLVDHRTASAAEIVTAALKDHGRAKVVGTRTYGKGVFQNTIPLNNGGALDITIGQFFSPDGHNLGDGVHSGEGIVPDVDAPNSAQTPPLTVAERTVAAEVTNGQPG